MPNRALSSFSKSALLPGIMAFAALAFIAADLYIVSETRNIRSSMDAELDRLDRIESIETRIRSLGEVYQKNEPDTWVAELSAINNELDEISDLSNNSNSTSLIPDLRKVVSQADSIHEASIYHRPGTEEFARSNAIINVILSRSSRITEQAVRTIRKENIDHGTNQLSSRWAVVQVLLLLACAFAVVLAFVVNRNRKLLHENTLKQQQLSIAKTDLEATNKELRETMLSKEEKEVMIKEIHHRVKNNLQIVKSLIRFQMYTVEDEGINEKFNECVNRVSAMSLVHERTYLSKDLANINVKEYLDQLIKDLIYSYSVNIEVEQDINIELETLTVDTLVPLGLLINEVISNAFKHAFQGRDHGKITVHIHGEEETGLIVRIGDDGIGLPSKENWTNHESLGMDLIHTLTTQLDGEVILEDRPGTMYRVSTRSADAGIQVRA